MEPLHPLITTITEKKMAGLHLQMSLAQNRTAELWRSFMPVRKDIPDVIGTDLYSLEIYPPDYFDAFDPTKMFEKWALTEVQDHYKIPAGMQPFTLGGGLYAVFHYKGSSADISIFDYIFRIWLPASEYLLDHRPHFAVMGEKYKNTDPDSEEDLWIPIRPKG